MTGKRSNRKKIKYLRRHDIFQILFGNNLKRMFKELPEELIYSISLRLIREFLYTKFNSLRDKATQEIKNEIDSELSLHIKSIKAGEAFVFECKDGGCHQQIHLPQNQFCPGHWKLVSISPDNLGLSIDFEGNLMELHGIAKKVDKQTDVEVKVAFVPDNKQPKIEKKVTFKIYPNPRDLWKNIPTSQDIEYYKCDTDSKVIIGDGLSERNVVVASVRGRTHANLGTPRDDDFQVKKTDTGWYILALADGAGSAPYSRKGSEIATKFSLEHIESHIDYFDAVVQQYVSDSSNADYLKSVRKEIGNMLWRSIEVAREGIRAEADRKLFLERQKRDIVAVKKRVSDLKIGPGSYATTLLLCVVKQFSQGWFVASFWIGDGAIAIYSEDTNSVDLLGLPQQGDYSGQTIFITSDSSLVDSAELSKRLEVRCVKDFTAILLMTDGVSDPLFETDAQLQKIESWKILWSQLTSNEECGAHLNERSQTIGDHLIRWADFYSPGNHDDRTIAVIY